MQETKTTTENIEFADFSQSVTTEEFIAVLELVGAVNDNFERALKKRDATIQAERDELEKMEKELGKYDNQVINKRRGFGTLEDEINAELSSSYRIYIRNYDGVIEFLTRFNLCGTIKKRNIANLFKIKKDVKKN